MDQSNAFSLQPNIIIKVETDQQNVKKVQNEIELQFFVDDQNTTFPNNIEADYNTSKMNNKVEEEIVPQSLQQDEIIENQEKQDSHLEKEEITPQEFVKKTNSQEDSIDKSQIELKI